jgi:hypothetical protein
VAPGDAGGRRCQVRQQGKPLNSQCPPRSGVDSFGGSQRRIDARH